MAGKKKATEDKVIDVEAEEVEAAKSSGGSLLTYFLLFVLVVGGLGFAAYKYAGADIGFDFLQEEEQPAEVVVVQKVEEVVVDEEAVLQTELSYGETASEDATSEESVLEEVAGVIDGVSIAVGEAALEIVEDVAESVEQSEILNSDVQLYGGNSAEIDALKKQNQNILLYLSAQNMADLSGDDIDAEALKLEVEFFKKAAGDEAKYSGKIQLIEFALESEVKSVAELSEELKNVAQVLESKEEESLWQNLQDSIFGLVKVTKLSEEEDGDYPKILLAQKALQGKDLKKAIELMEKVEAPESEAWIDDVHKLQRLHESVSYLTDMTRKKLVQ